MEPVSEAIRKIRKFAKCDPPAFAVFNGEVFGSALGRVVQKLVYEHGHVLRLGTDQLFDVGNGVEVIDRCLVRFNLDLKLLLDKQNQVDRGK